MVLQGKRKIVGVENRSKDEGNGYLDMPPLGVDVDLPLYEKGEELAYVRLDHLEIMNLLVIFVIGGSILCILPNLCFMQN
jgi:hypothetical protein